MDIDGTGRQQVTATPAAEATPVWSPDATRIAYAVRADGGTDVEIMFRAADGTGGATQMTDNAFPDTDPAWSPPLPGWPDGLIAFESARTGDSDRNIYVMDSGGGAVANVTPPRDYHGVPYQGHDDAPSWSPDGRIAFTHTFLPNAGGLPAIWTVAADGSGLSRISTDPTLSASEPAWSPDGQHVAYVGTAGTDRNIAVMAADGTGSVQVDTSTSHDIAPDWQEDSVDPQTTISAGPSGSAVATSATVEFTSDEPGSTFECSLDGQPFVACTSPRTWTPAGRSARTAYASVPWTRWVASTRHRPPSRGRCGPAGAAGPAAAAPVRPPPTPVPVHARAAHGQCGGGEQRAARPDARPGADDSVGESRRFPAEAQGRGPRLRTVGPHRPRRCRGRAGGHPQGEGPGQGQVARSPSTASGSRPRSWSLVTSPTGATVSTAEKFWLRG